MGKLRCILSSPLGSENKMVCLIWRIRRRVLPLHSNFYSVIRMIQQGKHICFGVRRRGVRALSIGSAALFDCQSIFRGIICKISFSFPLLRAEALSGYFHSYKRSSDTTTESL